MEAAQQWTQCKYEKEERTHVWPPMIDTRALEIAHGHFAAAAVSIISPQCSTDPANEIDAGYSEWRIRGVKE